MPDRWHLAEIAIDNADRARRPVQPAGYRHERPGRETRLRDRLAAAAQYLARSSALQISLSCVGSLHGADGAQTELDELTADIDLEARNDDTDDRDRQPGMRQRHGNHLLDASLAQPFEIWLMFS
jgi:hypothetical protein